MCLVAVEESTSESTMAVQRVGDVGASSAETNGLPQVSATPSAAKSLSKRTGQGGVDTGEASESISERSLPEGDSQAINRKCAVEVSVDEATSAVDSPVRHDTSSCDASADKKRSAVNSPTVKPGKSGLSKSPVVDDSPLFRILPHWLSPMKSRLNFMIKALSSSHRQSCYVLLFHLYCSSERGRQRISVFLRGIQEKSSLERRLQLRDQISVALMNSCNGNMIRLQSGGQ